jgi:hypothetical protein
MKTETFWEAAGPLRRVGAIVLGLLLVCTGFAFAQTGNGAITGTVADAQGAMVGGATVKITQVNTGTTRTVTTNGAGQFNVPSLQPATYSVTVEAQGFKSYQQNIVLLADQIRDMDVKLEVGAITQRVTVETSAVQVNTISPTLGQVIEQSRLVDIPLNGRNAADLTLLVPGAVNLSANNAGTQQGDTKQVPGAEAISVNGTRPDQIGYNLDGASNEDLMSNTNNPFPFPDALQEFSVQTNSFDAQYGNNAGAVVNVVTKSGTNNWHGDAFEFVRNRVFNAANYFGYVGGKKTVDPLKRNQFGATIGGPIHKNTTFIFGGWQKTIIRSANNASTATVPIPANLNGDFSNYSTVGASNPKGKVVTITNPFTHTPYADPSNIGPLDPVALNMAKLLPIASASANGFVTYATPIQQNFDEYIVRVDQVFRGQDRLFGRFYMDRYKHAPTFDGKNLLTANTGSSVHTQNWVIGYTRVFSPNLVNTITLGYVRSASDRTQQGGPGGTVPDMTSFGSSIWQLPKAQSGMRNFAVSGDFTIGGFTDGMFIRNTGDLRELINWNKGKHNFTFGFDGELDQSNVRNTDLENGSFSFTDDVSGLAMANFLLGYQHQFSQTSGNFSDSRENPIGVYGNDKWKISPRFTLDYGLRWEPQQVMKEIWGRIEQFWPDAYAAGVRSSIVPSAPPGLFFIGDKFNGKTLPDRGESGDFNNFAPRVGVAWDMTGNGKMSLRAGGGLFYYSRLPGLFLNDASISAPFSLRIDLNDSTTGASQIGSLANPEVNYPSFTQGFPQRYTLKNVPKNATFVANPQVFGLQPNVKWITPEIYDWNATWEYQVRNDSVLHVSYVGTRGVHLRQDVNLNPGVYTAGSTAKLQDRRPYQPFGIIYQNRNSGANGYNGLQIDLEKRPAAGTGILNQITLLANYTLSKTMDYGLAENGGITDIGSSLGSGMSFYDPRQHDFETGYSVLDHRHRLVASFVWNLPKMTGSNGLVRNIVGGWQWTGIYSFVSGDPLTFTAGTDQSQTGNNLDRADYIGPTNQFGKRGSSPAGCSGVAHCVAWITTSNFAKPAAGNYGNTGKGNWRGPNLWDVDTGLLKNFVPIPSHEDFSFQLRGEFFNLFNHPQFADPNQTFSNGAFGSIRGTINGSSDYRVVQIALKAFF